MGGGIDGLRVLNKSFALCFALYLQSSFGNFNMGIFNSPKKQSPQGKNGDNVDSVDMEMSDEEQEMIGGGKLGWEDKEEAAWRCNNGICLVPLQDLRWTTIMEEVARHS